MIPAEICKADDPDTVSRASQALDKGGVIIIPTETVYGMAVNPENPSAIKRLYDIKGRDDKKPLTRFIPSPDKIAAFDAVLNSQARKCANRFFPGPLTMVVEEKDGTKTGIRMPDNECAHSITSQVPFFPGVTSMNISGEPPLTRIDEIVKTFSEKVDLIIDSGEIKGMPSTVAEFGANGITILRQGPVGLEDLIEHSTVTICFVCSGNICRSSAADYYMRDILVKRFSTNDLASFGFNIISGGTFQFYGNVPPDEIITIMNEDGIDISKHKSQGLTEEMLEQSDHVFVMDATHMQYIKETFPAYSEKAQFLDPNGDIPDPYEGGMDTYTSILSNIKHCVMEVIKRV